ncbi:hypothetical protein ABZ371_00070 [Streptomyces sp. NPDC005899]|uniref:hypothetical protein n=1 Tax=Streptomyces sp. NPDC005899 TaxID=3155716 RepID=UPI0033F810BC
MPDTTTPTALTDSLPAPVIALHHRLQSLDFPSPYRAGDKAARHAAVQADATLAWLFPTTLYAVVPAGLWHGYPPLHEQGLGAAAVAHLGSTDNTHAWWLHYSLTQIGHDEDGDLAHLVTLTAPCECGTYTSIEPPDEDALIVLLDELDTPPGTPAPCDWRLKIRRASLTDTRHTSVLDDRPPF